MAGKAPSRDSASGPYRTVVLSDTAMTKGSEKSSVSLATFLVGFVCLLALISSLIVYCIVLQRRLSEVESRMEEVMATLDRMSEEDIPQTGREDPPPYADKQTSDRGRSLQKRRSRNTACHCRAALNRLYSILNKDFHPSAHVVPSAQTILEGGHYSWKWTDQADLPLTHHSFGDNRERDDENPFVITREGRYYVYCQVTFSGRNNAEHASEPCSYTVMVSPDGNEDEAGVLMYGNVSQFNKTPTGTGNSSEIVTQYNSVHTGGVFHLARNDKLWVKADVHSSDCIVHKLKFHTFFGIFLVGPSWSDDSSAVIRSP